jgi:F-type H+-transporting ATPase subunit a
MTPHVFGDVVFVRLGPFPITSTMVTSFLMSLFGVALSSWIANQMIRRPHGRAAAVGRIAYRFLRDLVTEAAGQTTPALEVFGGSLFLFIAFSVAAAQLPGVTAPTANLSTTSALAVLVFLAVPVAGIRSRGLRSYLKAYLEPNPVLFPLHLISELSRTLALSLRLFGNMMSGHLVVALLVALVGLFVPVPLMALDLLIGLLQAYIFTILTCVYIGAALRVRGEHTS